MCFWLFWGSRTTGRFSAVSNGQTGASQMWWGPTCQTQFHIAFTVTLILSHLKSLKNHRIEDVLLLAVILLALPLWWMCGVLPVMSGSFHFCWGTWCSFNAREWGGNPWKQNGRFSFPRSRDTVRDWQSKGRKIGWLFWKWRYWPLKKVSLQKKTWWILQNKYSKPCQFSFEFLQDSL